MTITILCQAPVPPVTGSGAHCSVYWEASMQLCGYLAAGKGQPTTLVHLLLPPIFVLGSKRGVHAANFSLHEAHCLLFLTLCPECDKPVAQNDMKSHQTEAHKQFMNNLLMMSIKMKWRSSQQLEVALTCESTNSGMSCHKDVNFQISEASTNAKFIYSTGTADNLCVRCNKSFPDDQYSQHQNKSSTAHKLTEVLAGQSTSKPSSDPPQPSTSLAPSSSSEKATAWKDLCPKGKGRYHPLTSKTSPKPSKNKRMVGFPSPTRGRLSTSPQALKDTWSYDLLVTCAHCNVILPLPTLQKHEIPAVLDLPGLQGTPLLVFEVCLRMAGKHNTV
ncbi:XIAP-associated factor 1 [Anas acuta]|uniref:XIAP-associated factor 1 n=1 Tax=Anas acuta TaxID=28680 RepID=UPI0035C93375